MKKKVFFFSYSHSFEKKRIILNICALLPISDILISELRLSGYLGGKKWAVDGSAGTMNGRQIHLMHTLKLQRRKKKHNIALVIDKDIQFQYQQRADRLDNVIC